MRVRVPAWPAEFALGTAVAAVSAALLAAAGIAMWDADGEAAWWGYVLACGLNALASGVLVGRELWVNPVDDWRLFLVAGTGWMAGMLMPVSGIWLLSGVVAWQTYALAGVFGGVFGAGAALLGYAIAEMARIDRW